MGRPRKEEERQIPIETIIDRAPKPTAIDEMPLTNYEEYKKYNAAARKENRRLRVCRYPCRPCPVPLHPTERIVFGRSDQPMNAIPVYLSNHLIDFKKTLYPGKAYDLPRVVINYLAEKGTAQWEVYEKADGSSDTRIASIDPRFTLRTIYQE